MDSANLPNSTGGSAEPDAVISWRGDSYRDICSFPDGPRGNLGHALRLVQRGIEPPDYKPVQAVGPGVFELRDEDERAWYRVLYLKKTKGRVFVLHCFEKKSNQIEQKDIDTAQKRLAVVNELLRQEERDEKRKARRGPRNDR